MFKKLIAKAAFKLIGIQLVELLLDEFVWPMAENYVKKSDNSYDDAILEQFKNFIKEVLNEMKK